MIQTHSEDPDVAAAASAAYAIINEVLAGLATATEFDYGGHHLKLDDYGVCTRCTVPIAEAQAAELSLLKKADEVDSDTVREHLQLAARLFHLEGEAAIVRAEFHNGHSTEPILNRILGYEYERHIGDDYQHSHAGGVA